MKKFFVVALASLFVCSVLACLYFGFLMLVEVATKMFLKI